jgi:hypothetical protein
MADELLESIDRSLESKVRKVTGQNHPKSRGALAQEQEDIGVSVIASGKNKDFIEAIKNRKFGILSLAPDPRDTKIKTDIHKKMAFLNPKPKKEKAIRSKKEPEFDDTINDRVFKPKLSDLTAKQIQKSLHLFRGAKVPNPPPASTGLKHKSNHHSSDRHLRDEKHPTRIEKKHHEKEHKHKSSHPDKHRHDNHRREKEARKVDDHRDERNDRHRRIEKEKHHKEKNRQSNKHRDYDDHSSFSEKDDFSMEVRDLFDLDRENQKSHRIGEYEDLLEMERQEKRRRQKDRRDY